MLVSLGGALRKEVGMCNNVIETVHVMGVHSCVGCPLWGAFIVISWQGRSDLIRFSRGQCVEVIASCAVKKAICSGDGVRHITNHGRARQGAIEDYIHAIPSVNSVEVHNRSPLSPVGRAISVDLQIGTISAHDCAHQMR